MQRERDAFANEMSGDRDARAKLPVVMAELAAARKLLDQMGDAAAERLMLGKESIKQEGGGSSSKQPPSSKRGADPAAAAWAARHDLVGATWSGREITGKPKW